MGLAYRSVLLAGLPGAGHLPRRFSCWQTCATRAAACRSRSLLSPGRLEVEMRRIEIKDFLYSRTLSSPCLPSVCPVFG